MKRTMNIKDFFASSTIRLGGAARRAAAVLLVTVLTAVTAWAETETVSGITAYTASHDGATLTKDGDNYTLTMPDADVTAADVFSMQTTTETKGLAAGWNWFSTYCEITLDDMKDALVYALAGASVTIQSKTQNTTYNGRRWTEQLSWDVAQMYLIKVKDFCEISLEGNPIDPAEHPVTIIEEGDNWIGFPFAQNMSVANAFAGFAVEGDIVISQTASACYSNGAWKGTLKNLESGQGYIYKSAATEDRTFTYPVEGGADSGSNDSYNGDSHGPVFDYHDYQFNRPLVAAIMIDGQYVTTADSNLDEMEVVAFANGECRGNRFTLTNRYVENSGEPYPVLGGMPIYYDNEGGEEVSFLLYANGIEYTDCEILYGSDPLTINTGEDHVEGWMNPENPIILSFTTPAVYLELSDTGANADAIEENNNCRANVTLQDRTLWKDGAWNTLCLPFSMTAEQVTAQLAPSALMELDVTSTYDGKQTGFDAADGTLYLYFKDATTITAGKPYLIKWSNDDDWDNPDFTDVTISNVDPNEQKTVSADGKLSFIGNFSPVTLDGGDNTKLYLGVSTNDNGTPDDDSDDYQQSTLYYPNADMTINAFRAYFHVDLGTNSLVKTRLFFGDGDNTEANGIKDIVNSQLSNSKSDEAWYDLSGRRISVPSVLPKGVYINKGKKVIIK